LSVGEATQKANGWRAAAWWLERRLPETFGFTKPKHITQEKLEKFMTEVIELILLYVHDKNDKQELYQRLNTMLHAL
jgi:hypothetical protein